MNSLEFYLQPILGLKVFAICIRRSLYSVIGERNVVYFVPFLKGKRNQSVIHGYYCSPQKDGKN